MYLKLKEPQFPYVMQTRSGFSIELNNFYDLVTFWVVFCRQEYKIPKDAKIIVDAGANIGVFSIFASQEKTRKIYAIEPFPKTYTQLTKNITNNNLEKYVQLIPLALSSSTGLRTMDSDEGPSQTRWLLDKSNTKGVQVPTTSLEDFLNSIDLPEIDFLKMDIEGGEYEVFNSVSSRTLQRIKHIAMEYHPQESKQNIFRKIEDSNFKLTHDYKISDVSGVAYFTRN